MPTLEPQQAQLLLEAVYLPGLQNEQKITQTVIEAIPLDKGDYRPDEISMSAITLAWHMVATEKRFMSAVATGAFDFTPISRPESVTNSRELADWYATDFQANLDRVKQTPGEDLVKIIPFRGMFNLPGVMYLNFLINHSIHHRGQLSMYLRPMGSKVPTIYGESYDAAQARKALEQTA